MINADAPRRRGLGPARVGLLIAAIVIAGVLQAWLGTRSGAFRGCQRVRATLLNQRLSRQEVRALLGEPRAAGARHDEYRAACWDARASGRADLLVLFRDGRVLGVVQ